MEQFRLVIKLDTGAVIEGCTVIGGEEDLQKLREILEHVNDLDYLTLDIPNGHVYLPKSMIQRSYFQIEITG